MQHNRGFSLVEMLMLLTLLTVVSVPLVASINSQSKEISKASTQSLSNLAVDKLFDVVDPDNPDLVAQKIDTPNCTGNGGCTTNISVNCDPAVTTCTSTERSKGPFFFRRYIKGNDSTTLTIQVGISDENGAYTNLNGMNSSSKVTLYEKKYILSAYRVLLNKTVEDANSTPSIDALGQSWFSIPYTTANGRGNYPLASGIMTGDGCFASSTNPAPYTGNINIKDTCQPSYYFKVNRNTPYVLNVYFKGSSTLGACGNDDRSTQIVDLNIREQDASLLVKKPGLDIGKKAGTDTTAQLTESITFTPTTSEIIVQPKITPLCPGSSVKISALELKKVN